MGILLRRYPRPLILALALVAFWSQSAFAGWFYPDLPIKVTYRGSMMTESKVAIFTNTSNDKYLLVIVSLYNATTSETHSYKLALSPGKSHEIGWTDGWGFVSGEKIVVTNADYSTLKLTVP